MLSSQTNRSLWKIDCGDWPSEEKCQSISNQKSMRRYLPHWPGCCKQPFVKISWYKVSTRVIKRCWQSEEGMHLWIKLVIRYTTCSWGAWTTSFSRRNADMVDGRKAKEFSWQKVFKLWLAPWMSRSFPPWSGEKGKWGSLFLTVHQAARSLGGCSLFCSGGRKLFVYSNSFCVRHHVSWKLPHSAEDGDTPRRPSLLAAGRFLGGPISEVQ